MDPIIQNSLINTRHYFDLLLIMNYGTEKMPPTSNHSEVEGFFQIYFYS